MRAKAISPATVLWEKSFLEQGYSAKGYSEQISLLIFEVVTKNLPLSSFLPSAIAQVMYHPWYRTIAR